MTNIYKNFLTKRMKMKLRKSQLAEPPLKNISGHMCMNCNQRFTNNIGLEKIAIEPTWSSDAFTVEKCKFF